MKALVLGGGSLKGAFQVGAIQAVLESGFEPEMIYGISAGSLNATYLINQTVKQCADNQSINWPSVSKSLIEFWLKNITQPADIALERSRFSLGYNTLMSRFDGLLDPSPLHNLIRQNIDADFLRRATIKLKVGAVNIITGRMVYATPKDENFIDYVLASSSIPMLMPAVQIAGNHRSALLDGGLRVVAPLRVAFEDGATDVVCIACHAEHIHEEPFNYRNFLKLIERVKDINVNQIVNSDISWAENYVEKENLKGRPLSLRVIRPQTPLKLDMLNFNSDDVARLIVQGFETAWGKNLG